MTTTELIGPEERLLVLASCARLDPAELDEARTLADRVTDWSAFAALAEENATAPLARISLERAGILAKVPAGVVARLDATAAKVAAANDARLAVGRTMFAAFAERGVPVVILKGVLFAETIYGDPHYKKMNDIDILVRREDLDAIYDVYAKLGFFSAAELVGGSPRKQEKFSHHAPPFFSRDLACMVGTHWGLITPLAPYTIDYAAIWSRVVDVDFQGIPAKAMAPEDNLHHLCVHLPYYKTGVRELADIFNLVRHHGPRLDWRLFLGEVRKAGTENLVYHALSLAHRLSPRPEVEDVLRALRPRVSWYFARDAAKKTASARRLLRSRSVHMSRIEKAYADFRATNDAREKQRAYGRIVANIVYPPADDVARLSSLDAPKGGALLAGRLAAPWRISRVFARDLGAGIYAAMLAKLTVDVCRATIARSLGRGRTDDGQGYAAYARKLGVTVEALTQLKEALE